MASHTPKTFPDVHTTRQLLLEGLWGVGSHAHIWWHCPLIKPFWEEVINITGLVQGSPIRLDPWVALFHCSDTPEGSYRKSVTPHMLNAAKSLIPRFWKQTTVPSITAWLSHIEHIYQMEDLTMALRNQHAKSNKIWAPWLSFVYSAKYTELMSTTKS